MPDSLSSAPSINTTLAPQVYECARLTGEFRLRSEILSSKYLHNYLSQADPALLRDVTEAPVELLPYDVEDVAGLGLCGNRWRRRPRS
jgi:orotate phosphoribosyltransferase